mmetsp:Transcript_29299/g.75933  ORF Transcript_29299/g.75933 Transcript_29299/m.75933 type:complete len:110 (-) Transcript_29299:563-892(-)
MGADFQHRFMQARGVQAVHAEGCSCRGLFMQRAVHAEGWPIPYMYAVNSKFLAGRIQNMWRSCLKSANPTYAWPLGSVDGTGDAGMDRQIVPMYRHDVPDQIQQVDLSC